MNIQNLKERFSRQHLFAFFLICAFPFHIWKIIMLIMDSSWIIQRSGFGSFIGVASISMIYAFFESLLLFLILLIFSLLIPWKWPVNRVFTLLSFIAIWIPLWDMIVQGYTAYKMANPGSLVSWVFSTQDQMRYRDPLLTTITIIFFSLMAIIILLISYNQKFQQTTQSLLDRVATLSAFYLILDLFGIIVATVRILN